MQPVAPKVYEGEVLPAITMSVVLTDDFERACGQNWEDALGTLKFDPFAHEARMLHVVLDPWADVKHLPKEYREEKPNPGNVLPASPAVKKVVHA